jgi:hypothetical protein
MRGAGTGWRGLAGRLRKGGVRQLAPEELEAVLAWIGAGRQGPARELAALLGPPDADPGLLWRVYQQLDRVLFPGGELAEEAAGVSSAVPAAQRRVRYRRLLAAFHPDRHAALADWLTPRAQAVQRSYAAFRGGSGGSAHAAGAASADASDAGFAGRSAAGATSGLDPAPHLRPGRGNPAGGRRQSRIPLGPGPMEWLRQALGPVRHLEAKILAGLLVGVLLPTLVVYANRGEVRLYEQDHGAGSVPESGAARLDRFATGVRAGADSGEEMERAFARERERVMAHLRQQEEIDRVAAREAEARLMAEREIARIEVAARIDALQRRAARDEAALRARTGAASDRGGSSAGVGRPAAPETARDARTDVASYGGDSYAGAEKPAVPETAARAGTDAPSGRSGSAAGAQKPAFPASSPAAGVLQTRPSQAGARTETQVLSLLEDYRRAFERGDLDGFLRLLGPEPVEGGNRGRGWFADTYAHLFAQSTDRELRLDLPRVFRDPEGGWDVRGTFNLSVAFGDGVVFRTAGPVRYQVQERPEGLRIHAIEY